MTKREQKSSFYLYSTLLLSFFSHRPLKQFVHFSNFTFNISWFVTHTQTSIINSPNTNQHRAFWLAGFAWQGESQSGCFNPNHCLFHRNLNPSLWVTLKLWICVHLLISPPDIWTPRGDPPKSINLSGDKQKLFLDAEDTRGDWRTSQEPDGTNPEDDCRLPSTFSWRKRRERKWHLGTSSLEWGRH